MVARELLDVGEPRQAFALCAAAAPASVPAKVDAAFHAGWIALRFLGDAQEAAKRFDAAIAVAATPLSIARADYWRGRAAEALGPAPTTARRFYERAAAYPDRLLRPARRRAARARRARPARARRRRRRPTRATRRRASSSGSTPPASTISPTRSPQAAARPMERRRRSSPRSPTCVAAHGDAAANVAFGKIVTERGFALDATAFPTFGVPQFAPLAGFGRPAERLCGRAAGERVRAPGRVGHGRQGPDADPAVDRAATPRAAPACRSDAARLVADPAFNVAARRRLSRPDDRRRGRLAGAGARRLQRRRRPRRAMDRRLRRPAHRRGRPGRLGRAHPVRRDARLRRARQREHRRLPRPLRRGARRRSNAPRIAEAGGAKLWSRRAVAC